MSQNNRIDRIMELLYQKKFITIQELSDLLHYSESTIRRDLNHLENLNVLKRVSGGAILIDQEHVEHTTDLKLEINSKLKWYISDLAIDLIEDFNTVFLDSSSTSLFFARQLQHKNNINVYTTSLNVATIVDEQEQNNINIVGGNVRHGNLQGILTITNIKKLFFDFSFLSCRGFNPSYGTTELSEYEALIKQTVVSQAKSNVLLCDSTKFNRDFINMAVDIEKFDYLVTDLEPSEEIKNILNSKEIELLY